MDNTSPIPAGIIIFNNHINVMLMVSPNTFPVNGANNKMESCHLKPNSTKDTVGKIANKNNITLIPIQDAAKSTPISVTSKINPY